MRIFLAEESDIPQLYKLQLIAFESEAEMTGSRMIPALMETEEEYTRDFVKWTTLKAVDAYGKIIGSIRYKRGDGIIEVGRLMVQPRPSSPRTGKSIACNGRRSLSERNERIVHLHKELS